MWIGDLGARVHPVLAVVGSHDMNDPNRVLGIKQGLSLAGLQDVTPNERYAMSPK